jgi:hypothetical protein
MLGRKNQRLNGSAGQVNGKGIGTGRVGDPSMQYRCEILQQDALTAG